MIDRVEAFILAGGQSRRMGAPKALLEVGGRPIIARVADVLRGLFDSIGIVTDRPEEVAFLGLATIPDIYHGKGPLGGLNAALEASKERTIFLVSADLPFLDPDLISSLFAFHSNVDITIPSSADGIHPLCGFYERSLRDHTEHSIEEARLSMQGLIREVRSRIVSPDELAGFDLRRILFNVNTPEELEEALRMA